MTFRPADLRKLSPVLALAICAGFAPPANSQVVDIAWSAARSFETKAPVAPGKFLEICGRLTKGQEVAWLFAAGRPVDFNIHYHAGGQVLFPERRPTVSDASGKFVVAQEQDYCWMWTNPGAAPVSVSVTLQLQ